MQDYSGLPLNNLDSNASMLGDQRLRDLHLLVHLLQLLKSLLELFTGRRILSTSGNKLHSVELCLVIEVVQKLDDLVEFVEIVDLNLAFLKLGERCKGSDSAGTHFINLVGQHVAERGNRLSLDS